MHAPLVKRPVHPSLPPCSKSQIQTFLEQNEGPGLQHMALKTDDIFSTMRQIRARCVRQVSVGAGCPLTWRYPLVPQLLRSQSFGPLALGGGQP